MKIKNTATIISLIILSYILQLNVYAVPQTPPSTQSTTSSTQPTQSSVTTPSRPASPEATPSSSKVSSVAPSSTPQAQQTPPSKAEASSSTPPSSAPQSQQVESKTSPRSSYSEPSSSKASSAVSSEEQTSSLDLPEVTSEDISSPRAVTSVTYTNSNNSKVLGIIACVLIGIGILIVLIIILSSRKPSRNTFSRKRYGKLSCKKNKHLLADKYYRNIKRR